MKKKNLIVLLLIPFIVSILATTAINVTYVFVDVDISGISWAYDDVEAFKLSESDYVLEADGVNQRNYAVAKDNDLVWSIENMTDDSSAEIVEKGGTYYLRTLKEGSVIVTCSTKKGNVSRRFEAVIYDSGVITAQFSIKAGTRVDPVTYVGEYDLVNGVKRKAEIDIKITALPYGLKDKIVATCSDNVSVDITAGKITVLGGGEATLTLSVPNEDVGDYEMKFTVVQDGVNVYNYDDLMRCTNYSSDGEIVVLRKSLQSLEFMKTELGKQNNVECFGNYNQRTGKFSFASEVYSFATTYNRKYIDEWNKTAKRNGYEEVSDTVYAGVRVQKDFYGNGYTINMHNLTFPYKVIVGTGGIEIPTLSSDNLFRGPRPFYALGDPNGMPLVEAYGQDNIGFYLDGNGITVNDLVLQNCDVVNTLSNLTYVGTVMDVNGDGVTVKNCKLSYGKNILRSFSSNGLTVDNCMLSNSQNFLFVTGANEYAEVNDNEIRTFFDENGNEIKTTLAEYMKPHGVGDDVTTAYLRSMTVEKAEMIKKALSAMQSALANIAKVQGEYKGSAVIKDCQFSQSGIASIVFESLFNGPFLYSKVPSLITDLFSSFTSGTEQKPLIPSPPENVSGISYPVEVTVTGDTCFYDYKKIGNMDISGLINENISTMLREFGGSLGGILGDVDVGSYDIDIDDIFPLKNMVKTKADQQGSTFSGYTNVIVAYYGGGTNLSKIDFDLRYDHRDVIKDSVSVDLADQYITMSSNGQVGELRGMMYKIVTVVTGFEPFKFRFTTEEWLGQSPSDNKMRENSGYYAYTASETQGVLQ